MEFNIEKTVAYWLNSAKYDLSVADSLFRSRKYPYALFFGHLALEKILKALVVKDKETCPIYTFPTIVGGKIDY